MPAERTVTETEYRLVGTDGMPGGIYEGSRARQEVEEAIVRCDDEWPEDAPHRAQSRIVTKTSWEDVPAGGEQDA